MDYVLALGGSIICPKQIDAGFLRDFYFLIEQRIKKGDRFVIVTGGGDVARHYQKSALLINGVGDEERDWIGIHATYLNAHLLRAIFTKYASDTICNERGKINDFDDCSVIIASGWSPGRSTDYVATCLAVDMDIENIIILSKQDYVYDGDPEKSESAQPIDFITWDDYKKIIPTDWTPGLSAPVDPIASKLAADEEKELVVANGKDLDNLEKILDGKTFKGTKIAN